MDLVLPTRLDERYTTPDEVVTGTATYTQLSPVPDRRDA